MRESVSPIRVLHVIGVMNRGGAETMIMNLYRAIDRSKVQFDFVENTSDIGIFEDEIKTLGGKIYHCPKFNGNVIKYLKWWEVFFKQHNNTYTAVHGHIGSTAAMYLYIAKKHGITTIAHSHSTYTKSLNLRLLGYRVLSYPTRFIADYFFACSKMAGISRYGKCVSVKVLNNAIDTQLFKFDEKKRYDLRREFQLNNKIVYGHVGRFTEAKNHSFLIKVFSKIHEKNSNSVLLLIGDGPLKDSVEKQVEELNLSNSVSFLGLRDNVNELLQSLDLLIFPSVFEGLPVTLVEAQCSGLRCLISDQISEEAILVPELVTRLPLNDEELWAEKALELSDYQRSSFESEIKKAGFDIVENAELLQDFYMSKGT